MGTLSAPRGGPGLVHDLGRPWPPAPSAVCRGHLPLRLLSCVGTEEAPPRVYGRRLGGGKGWGLTALMASPPGCWRSGRGP